MEIIYVAWLLSSFYHMKEMADWHAIAPSAQWFIFKTDTDKVNIHDEKTGQWKWLWAGKRNVITSSIVTKQWLILGNTKWKKQLVITGQ